MASKIKARRVRKPIYVGLADEAEAEEVEDKELGLASNTSASCKSRNIRCMTYEEGHTCRRQDSFGE